MDYSIYIWALADCIERDIKSRTDYRELGKSIGFSYRHIREIFQKATGISLARYILARKIANIAFEIRHSPKSITEIAFEYEFSNLDTFARAFRRETGLSPSAFRKSAYLCGRRIICPGVYAPVILNLDHPHFTLPKLKEVNELSEMMKTTDSCILYGVPKVYYGVTVDGQKQLTPFPMCLQAVLNYMGQNIGYTHIMASSGAAFRQRWNAKGWDYAAIDIRNTYREHLKAFELAFTAAGRSFKIIEETDKKKAKRVYLEHIKSELDCGRPVIALGVVGPPEACIVTGYKDNGERLLGWSLYQTGGSFGENLKFDESGYFLKDDWWENTEAIMSVGEEAGKPVSVKTILENALALMTQERIEAYEGTCGVQFGGQAAYEAWAEKVEDDASFADGADLFAAVVSHEDQECMLSEGRSVAAAYLRSLAGQYPALESDFTECAGLLKSASECVDKMRQARGGQGAARMKEKFCERVVRVEIAANIREAAKFEKAACVALEKIIRKL